MIKKVSEVINQLASSITAWYLEGNAGERPHVNFTWIITPIALNHSQNDFRGSKSRRPNQIKMLWGVEGVSCVSVR